MLTSRPVLTARPSTGRLASRPPPSTCPDGLALLRGVIASVKDPTPEEVRAADAPARSRHSPPDRWTRGVGIAARVEPGMKRAGLSRPLGRVDVLICNGIANRRIRMTPSWASIRGIEDEVHVRSASQPTEARRAAGGGLAGPQSVVASGSRRNGAPRLSATRATDQHVDLLLKAHRGSARGDACPGVDGVAKRDRSSRDCTGGR